MSTVIIPFSSFLNHWGTEDEDYIEWLEEYVGEIGFFWKTEPHPCESDCAHFWFRREEDAVAFKLRWM